MNNLIANSIITKNNYTQFINTEIGGKARNLFRLKELGLNVPNWVVLPYESLIHNEEIKNFEFLAEEVFSLFQKGMYLAVRSSANVEDSNNHSFAGQFSSILFVERENLADAIQLVFESARSEQVQTYCKHHGLDVSNIKMSIVVQEMINADVSGVAFGANPVNGSMESKIINTAWGIGEGLVSGQIAADLYEIKNQEVTKIVADKEFMYKFDLEKKKLTKQPTPTAKRGKQTLTTFQIEEIETVLNQTDEYFGGAQDIEFTIYDDKIYYLQSRPITNITTSREKCKTHRQVWDNSNIVESYPGHSSPLTFSFIRRVYEAVYIELSKLLGVSPELIRRNADTYKNMLGLIKGRVYYNLAGWYKTLSLLPGYSINAKFMEKMMGVKETFELPIEEKAKKKNYIGLIKSVFKILKSFFTLSRSRDGFLKLLDKTIEDANKKDYTKLNSNELLDEYENFEGTLLHNWKAPLVNDFFAMIFYGLLDKLTKKWLPNARPNFHNELLTGSSDIVSVEPISYMENIFTAIKMDEKAQELFAFKNVNQIWKALENESFSVVKKAIDAYINKFGDRSMGELKLETITYRQEPTTFIEYLKNALTNGINSIKKSNGNLRLKEQAEQELASMLKGRPVKSILYKYVLTKARTMISNRENLRFERTRAFGQVRRIFTSMGTLWAKENIINSKEDIFFLSRDEINDYIKGMACSTNVRFLIKTRKEEYDRWKNEAIPADRIETFGMVYQGSNFYPQEKDDSFDGETLLGIGSSAGKINAKVTLVTDPKDIGSLNGNILIATCTDPSWVTLFPTASGIIVERGSMLSHSAIVAREMGIPCIVGVDKLMQRLKSGDRVEMDGGTGRIKILD